MAKRDRSAPKSKEHKQIFRMIAAHGGTVVRGKGKQHYKVYDREGRFVCPISSSDSDWRANKNLVSQLRRAGLYPASAPS